MVIPSVNCETEECVIKTFKEIESFGNKWVHIDIVDGEFAERTTWNDPSLIEEKGFSNKFNIEVHLMVNSPEEEIDRWISSGVKRFIIHVESDFDLESINKKVNNNIEIMLALKPGTPIDVLDNFNDDFYSSVQILGVDPGPSGGAFKEEVLGKVRNLRKKQENVKIEVDGGVSYENIKRLKEAGVDLFVSASYIFKSSNPKEAYNGLLNKING